MDLDYFAERWRNSGISALHVAGWHYWEANAESHDYLRRLIDACHRRAILVYVGLELPHVSEKFWAEHPEWREQTALQQDAQLDWRKLMNLTSRPSFTEVSRGAKDVIGRFDWDGVNLAGLYFESLEGASNPARFTPMNSDVRAQFKQLRGFDPLELFGPGKPDPQRLRSFLDYRADLTRRQQEEWIDQIEAIRQTRPNLDFALTHVDDRFDTRMRDLIGADAARVLPLLDHHDFTFLIEDPATIWNLGPDRYPQIASRYQPLTQQTGKLAIDINIVERYQDVYPTKQQTGTELFQLVHVAAQAFPQVALYFENSILSPDLPLLSSAAANVDQADSKLTVDARYGVGIPWQGPALVKRPPLARSGRNHFVASGRIERDRARAKRFGPPYSRFQRQSPLRRRFDHRPADLLSKQFAGHRGAEFAPQEVRNRRRRRHRKASRLWIEFRPHAAPRPAHSRTRIRPGSSGWQLAIKPLHSVQRC